MPRRIVPAILSGAPSIVFTAVKKRAAGFGVARFFFEREALNFSDILEGLAAAFALVIIAGFLAYLVEKLNR